MKSEFYYIEENKIDKYVEMGKANIRAFAERLKKEVIETEVINGVEAIVEKDIPAIDLFNAINSVLEEMNCEKIE